MPDKDDSFLFMPGNTRVIIIFKLFVSTMTRLILVRHGETIENEQHIMQGQTQGILNATGQRQARELRESLKAEKIDIYISSDLARAVETCRILAEDTQAEVVTTPLLRERDWGGFTGRYIPDLKDEPWPDDIETIDDLKVRATKLLETIKEQYPDKTVLAVGHGIINKAIQSVYHGKPMNEIPRMSNGEARTLML